jgi:2-methylisocitrate lyase-like PEP mutase family enzyme
MTNFAKFKQLHKQDTAFMLGNVHDADSAIISQKVGFEAIGTSSLAIAKSLGLEDGENMSFEQLVAVVTNITKATTIPLTVDIEAGYSREITTICKNIKTLANLGVIGINFEDSVVVNNQRVIQNSSDFAKTIAKIKEFIYKNNLPIFLNVRTDYYIMGLENPLTNTLERVKQYEKAGADGIFVPFIDSADDIKQIVNVTNLPINVMIVPKLPNYQTLNNLGVKRISFGPFAYIKMMQDFEKDITPVFNNKTFDSLFK